MNSLQQISKGSTQCWDSDAIRKVPTLEVRCSDSSLMERVHDARNLALARSDIPNRKFLEHVQDGSNGVASLWEARFLHKCKCNTMKYPNHNINSIQFSSAYHCRSNCLSLARSQANACERQAWHRPICKFNLPSTPSPSSNSNIHQSIV